MVDLWDVEDPENKHNENVCQKLVQNPYPFRTVFRNSVYSVLSLWVKNVSYVNFVI